MSKVHGFVAEPHKKGYYLVSPATKDGEFITCHDLAGFCGSWEMKGGGVFFPSEDGSTFCNAALYKANMYAEQMNNKENK